MGMGVPTCRKVKAPGFCNISDRQSTFSAFCWLTVWCNPQSQKITRNFDITARISCFSVFSCRNVKESAKTLTLRNRRRFCRIAGLPHNADAYTNSQSTTPVQFLRSQWPAIDGRCVHKCALQATCRQSAFATACCGQGHVARSAGSIGLCSARSHGPCLSCRCVRSLTLMGGYLLRNEVETQRV